MKIYQSIQKAIYQIEIPNVLRIGFSILFYLILFLLLDWLAYHYQTLVSVSLWYPSLGLSFALLLIFGAEFLPIWIAAKWLSNVLIYQTPLSIIQTLVLAFIIFGGYGLAAYLLKHVMKIDVRIKSPRDLHWFTVAIMIMSFFVAVLSLILLSRANLPGYEQSSLLFHVFDWWTGDVIGILVISPIILVHGSDRLQKYVHRTSYKSCDKQQQINLTPKKFLISLIQFICILITIWIAFKSPLSEKFHIFYIVLLPVVWISLHHGFQGATIGIVLSNFGMMLAAGTVGVSRGFLLEIQAITLVIILTGLILGMVVDERRKNERKLQESEAKWRSLVEHAPIKITQVDRQGVIQSINYTAPFRSPEEVIGTPIYDILSESEIKPTKSALVDVFEKAHPVTYEAEIQHPNGSILWHENRVAPILQNGQVQAAVFISMDITQHRIAELRLQESQRFIQAISDANPSYMYIYDFEAGENIWVNKAWQIYFSEFTEVKAEGIKENQLISLVHPDDRYLLEKRAQELRDSSKLRWNEIEFRMKDRQGDWHWFQDRVSVFERTPNGEIRKIISSMIEITERKQAEYALKESQHFIQATSDTNPSYMYIYDYQIGKNIWMNKAWHTYLSEITGEDINGIEEQQLFSLFHSDDIALLDQRAKLLLEAPDLEWHEIELRVRNMDGNWHWFLDRGAVFERTEDGKISKIIASLIEVTDRKLAELALQESERKFKTLFETSNDAQVIADAEFILECNQATIDLLGYTDKAQLIGKSPAHFSPNYQPDGRNSVEKAQEMISLAYEKGTHRFDWLYQCNDKSTILMDTQFTAITLGGRNVLHVSARDITERVQMEAALQKYSEQQEEMVAERTQELHQAQEQLVRQERLAILGQLGGGIAHELRTPLGAIKNMAYFLNMVLDKTNDEIKEALEVIDKEVNTSAKIINSLLDYARPRPPMHVLTDINLIIKQVIERAKVPKNIQVMEILDEEITSIYADPNKLTQVFLNLVTNAIQAMPKGGQLSITSGEKDGEQIFVAITDTGLGISAENQRKLFQPLFTTKARGIGLGLSLVKMMVEEHDGKIDVMSEEGQGSTFTFTLPLNINTVEKNG